METFYIEGPVYILLFVSRFRREASSSFSSWPR